MAALDLASQPRTPTIYDIAAAAGVSHTTVSRALNGEDGMTPQTRARIVELAAHVGYRPNAAARVLAGRVRPQLAAVVVDGEHSRRAAALVEAVARAARDRGYTLSIVAAPAWSGQSSSGSTESIGEPGIRGVVVIVDRDGRPEAAALRAAMPCEVLALAADDRMPHAGGHPGGAMGRALAHLRELGHREIVQPVDGDSSADAGFRLVGEASLPPSTTAIVAPTISFAIGAMSGLRARGLRVPQDVSVIALEDHPDAAHVAPPLTAVADVDADERAHRTVAALIRTIEGSGALPGVDAEPRVVVRRSTGPVREAPSVR